VGGCQLGVKCVVLLVLASWSNVSRVVVVVVPRTTTLHDRGRRTWTQTHREQRGQNGGRRGTALYRRELVHACILIVHTLELNAGLTRQRHAIFIERVGPVDDAVRFRIPPLTILLALAPAWCTNIGMLYGA